MKKSRSTPGRFLIGSLVLFFAAAFVLPVVLEGQDNRLYVLAAVVSGAVLLGGTRLVSRLLFQDRILLVLSLALCGLGILVAALSDPAEGQKQAFRCAGALVMMLAGSLFVRVVRPSGLPALLPAVPSLVLLALPLVMDAGFHTGFISLALLMTAFVMLLSARKQLSAVFLALSGTALLLAQRDPAEAAVWSLTFLLLFWAYSGHPVILLAGAGFVVLAGYLANLLLPGLFSPAGTSSFPADVSPGFAGLELADPALSEPLLPGGSLFPRIAMRYGWIFTAGVLLFYPVMILRGSALARASGSRLHGLLAMGAVLLTGLEAIAALLSDFGIWPVPGLSLPGLSRDLPSLCAFLFLTGLCGGISVRNQADLEDDAHIAMLAD